jgi:hypothetical protein
MRRDRAEGWDVPDLSTVDREEMQVVDFVYGLREEVEELWITRRKKMLLSEVSVFPTCDFFLME